MDVKNLLLLCCVLSLMVTTTKGQFVKDNQAFVDAEGASNEIFKLNDSVAVFTYPIHNNWYKISTILLVETGLFNKEDSLIAANSTLYNAQGDAVGLVLKDCLALEYKKAKGRKVKHLTQVRIEGWCFYTKIYPNHIPEVQLLKLLNGRRVNLEDQLFEMKEAFRLEQKTVGDYTAYAFLRYNAEMHPKPDFQYLVILRGGSAFAVVSRERYLDLDKIKFQKEEWDFFISFYQKPNAEAEKAAIDLAYTFEKL